MEDVSGAKRGAAVRATSLVDALEVSGDHLAMLTRMCAQPETLKPHQPKIPPPPQSETLKPPQPETLKSETQSLKPRPTPLIPSSRRRLVLVQGMGLRV